MPKYKLTDPDEVERICKKYLDDCRDSREKNMVILKSGAKHTYGKWPSTEGLALALDISYGHLMRLISKAPDNDNDPERERTYGESESVSLLETDNESNELSTQDGVNTDVDDSTGNYAKGYREAQRAISETLARVRMQIIDEVTEGSDSGMIDSKIAQLRLSRLGIAAKVEQDNTRKVEIVGYTPAEIGELFT